MYRDLSRRSQHTGQYLNRSKLISYEQGNEPNYYVFLRKTRPQGWIVNDYITQIVTYLQQINKGRDRSFAGHQLGALAIIPSAQGNFSLAEITKQGVPQAVGYVESYSSHAYPYSTCTRMYFYHPL
jgi:hypothetical protein